jgi:hypothetical protein
MKLLVCRSCGDIVRVRREARTCVCGRSSGRYLEDNATVEQTEGTLSIALHNHDLTSAVEAFDEAPQGWHPLMVFRAYLNPLCETDVRYTPAPDEPRRPIVVYVGIEPDRLPDSFTPERRLAIKAGVEGAMAELLALGYDARWCGVATDPDAAIATLRAALADAAVDCVLVGAGLRTTEPALALFERLVNEVRASCPRAAICFNSKPEDSAAAVQRWVQPR